MCDSRAGEMHEGTVIAQPRVQVIIKRPRLTRLLDEAGARITLLLAPAGYGKTTLAREWTEEQDRVGWYAGAPGMVDVAGLSVGIAEVLGAMGDQPHPDMVERVRILAARGHDARGLAKAVSGGAPHGDWLLVVDDYHHALGSEDAEAFFEELVSLTEFRLLITSRERPRWLPARKVVYGEAAVVEMDALAFTDEEARAVLGDARDGIVAEARGWPAVIGLAAMRGSDDVASGLPPDDLYRFFAEDLFRSASPRMRDAMFRLALAGVEGARTMLGPEHNALVEEATERGFLTGGKQPAVHPLLRGFLLAKLRELDDAAIRDLVAEAIAYLAGQHRWDDCLFVLEQFPDDELIVGTLRRGLAEILDSGRLVTVSSWLQLSERQAIRGPLLLLAQGEIALRQRDDFRAQALGEQAGAALEPELAARAYLLAARAAHLRSAAAPNETKRLIDLMLAQPASPEVHVEGLWIAFSAEREQTDSDAATILQKLRNTESTNPSHPLRLLTATGVVLCDEGRVSEGCDALELAVASISQAHDPFARTNSLQYLAYAYLLAARYTESLAVTKRLMAEGHDTGLGFVMDHGLLRRAGALIGIRRFGDAKAAIEELRGRGPALSVFLSENVVLLDAKLRIAMGDLQRAAVLLDRDFGEGVRPAFRGELAAYRALVAAALDRLPAAEDFLAEDERFFRFVEASSLREIASAVVALRRKSRTIDPTERISALIASGQADAVVTGVRAYPELAAAASQSAQMKRAMTGLLANSRDADIARHAGLRAPRELRPRERLSPREREVYELLVQGRQNHEIAGALFISESTTKVHVRHIFEKLGVHSRAEAASLAGVLRDEN